MSDDNKPEPTQPGSPKQPELPHDPIEVTVQGQRVIVSRAVWERMKAGERGELWTIEVPYTLDGVHGTEKKRNLTGKELLDFRESMFRYGLTKFIEKGHWVLIHPLEIGTAHIFKQAHYFPE